jgi:hypothetical protein
MKPAGCVLSLVVAISSSGCGATKLQGAVDSDVASDSAAETQAKADAADPRIVVDVSDDAEGTGCFRSPSLAPRLPAPSDFDLHLSEGDPGYFPCGAPLTSEQVAAAHDAGAPMTDAGSIVCCYWVEERWGF